MREPSVIVTRSVFGVVALAAAVGGGIYAYDTTSSWWPAVFVGVMALYARGRAVPDLITDPQKGRRALFFGIPLLAAVGWLALADLLWGRWWLAVVTGFAVGGLGSLISSLSFPEIAAEEQQDSLERAGGGRVRAVPGLEEPARDPALEALLRAARTAGIRLTAEEEQRLARASAAGDHDEIAGLIGSNRAKLPVGPGR